MSKPLCATTPAFVLGNQQPRNGFDTLPRSGHSSYYGFPDYTETTNLPLRFYYKRANALRKDIIITEEGVIRNAIKIEEGFRPNATPYHEFHPMFEASDYDYVAEFKKMGTDEKIELLKNKEVEVIVMLKTNDDEEKIESKKQNNKSKRKYKSKNKEGGASMASGDISGGDMERAVQGVAEGGGHYDAKLTEHNAKPHTKEEQALGPKDGGAKVEGVNNLGTANAKITTVIDTINALDPDFAKHTTSLWVTIDFTGITPPLGSTSAIPTGPRATATVNPNQPIAFGPNFAFVTELVGALQVFIGLKQMRINLRVREPPTGFPFTLQQLALVLPFYDFGFTDWSVCYQNEMLTSTVRIGDTEFPMKWLDQKRRKVLRAREKEVLRKRDQNVNSSRAVYKAQSRARGTFFLSDFIKESRKK
jgi:hypothetical protein